jgi:hypothetical protein
MIIILFLFIIVALLLIRISQSAAESRRRFIQENPAKYYLDAGIVRVFFAVVTLVIGAACPPLWVLTLFLFFSGFYCLDMSKKFRKPQRDAEKSVTHYVAPCDIPRSNTFNAIRQ